MSNQDLRSSQTDARQGWTVVRSGYARVARGLLLATLVASVAVAVLKFFSQG